MAMVDRCCIAWQADGGRAQAALMLGHNNSAEDSRSERNTTSEKKLDPWQATWTPGPAHVFLHPRWANFGANKGLSSSETGQELECLNASRI